MTDLAFAEAKRLFIELYELPPDDRAARLDSRCRTDSILRARVQELLAAVDNDPGLPPTDLPRQARELLGITRHEVHPPQIGPYRVLRPLGEGGMGTVYLAEQLAPVRRRVAIKVIKRGMDSREVLLRFDAERQALAQMNHPNVAAVFDAGQADDGRPYFVMEYVDGLPLTTYCEKRHVSIRARMELLSKVCRAVQHAHQKGIIHRDLKPSNVLVRERDGVTEPMVIDFGVAKATHQRLTEQTLATQAGVMIGTPAYMSPEQADGNGLDVDTRTDVYALGVLLYELVSGALPFESARLRSAGLEEMRRIIREMEPRKPSTRITEALQVTAFTSGSNANDAFADAKRSLLRTRLREVRGELDWIAMRCLEKDRSRRYDSATALAQDIDRFLNAEPVAAGPPSVVYRAGKFVRKHRAALFASGTVFALLIGALVTTSLLYVRAEEARARARSEIIRSQTSLELLRRAIRAADPDVARGRDTTLLEGVLAEAERGIAELAPGQADVAAELAVLIGETYGNLGKFERAETNLRLAIQRFDQFRPPLPIGAARARRALAAVYSLQDRTDEAVELAETALQTLRAELGEVDLEVAEALEVLGASLTHVDVTLARAEVEAALAIRRQLQPPGDIQIGLNLLTLGELQLVERQHEAALPLLQDAAEILTRVHGDEHWHCGQADYLIAAALAGLGQIDASVMRFERAADTLEHVLGPDHPVYLDAVNSYAVFLIVAAGAPDRAIPFLQHCTATLRSFPGDSRFLMVALENLGTAHYHLGQYAEAEPPFQEAVAISSRLSGHRHPTTRRLTNNLQAILERLGRPAEAAALDNPRPAHAASTSAQAD